MKGNGRAFSDAPAKRERVPLLVGLMGASGSGKTYSALRLATGMQRVTGGEIYVIDTEHRRALHYADSFNFRHVAFDAPFSPLDYLAAIEHCVKQRAGVVIVDSMSHEHEGPGGVLEWHESELDRMAGDDAKKRERVKFAAWIKPKQARQRLINSILQLGMDAVFCFRAKEKIKMQPGRDPLQLGWMPIAGEEFLYEMTVNCLLYPASGGVPTWRTDQPGEKQMMKLPKHFASVFERQKPLDESIGESLAQWAEGDGAPNPPRATVEGAFGPQDAKTHETPLGEPAMPSLKLSPAVDMIHAAESMASLTTLAAQLRHQSWSDEDRDLIRSAIRTRSAELKGEQT